MLQNLQRTHYVKNVPMKRFIIPIFCRQKYQLIFIAFFLLTYMSTTGETAAAGKPFQQIQRVLVLGSYNLGYDWADSMNQGIKDVFDKSHLNVNVRYEFMDTKYLRPEEIFDQLRALYKTKYNRYLFDVIIATDNNAFIFMLRHRDELFPDTPVVFCGVSGYMNDMFSDLDWVTGFTESVDLEGTLDMMLDLHPEARNVAIISGTAISSRINQQKIEALMYKYTNRVKFIRLFNLSPKALQQELAKLPEDTIILYTAYFKMEDGTFLNVKESTSLVYQNSHLPMYSAWEYTLQGKGVIGGMMLSAEREGARAATYALRILNGTPVQALPVVYDNEIKPVFDYEMLEHFDIDHRRLPAGSSIVNEPQTFYYQYKYWIWAMAIFMLYQSAMIIWMGQNLIRRKQAEKQQRLLEAQLLHSQKMEAIGTFAGGIAHDLNNILGAIGACSEVALEDLNTSSPVHEDLQHVISATNRGKALIRQVLDFSRKPTLEKKPIHMGEMVQECLNLLEQVIPDNVAIEFRNSAEDLFIHANPAKLHQVVINLCSNAEQAMRATGGTLTIDLCRYDTKNKNCQHRLKPGSYVQLQVSDNGHGIPADILPRIFDPFFTTRNQAEGTGLGLSVVHGIVTGYDGQVFATSSLGEGSIFKVFIPLMSDRELRAVTDSVSTAQDIGSLNA